MENEPEPGADSPVAAGLSGTSSGSSRLRARVGTSASTVGTADSLQSAKSHHDYLDSLVPPSAQEFSRISEIQNSRQHGNKRRSRELKRRSAEHAASAEQSRPTTSASSVEPVSGGMSPHPSTWHGYHHRWTHHRGNSSHFGILGDIFQTRAATIIQRTYRGYRARRQINGLGIDAGTRWTHAIREAQFRQLTTPRPRQSSTSSSGEAGDRSAAARRNWHKVAAIARRAAGDGDSDTSSISSSSSRSSSDKERQKADKKRRQESKARRKKKAKTMALQYFLEMVDLKHRYGSNLRVYHEEWKKADTHENFFYWLDYGEGRFVNIDACPRERLDREQVRYLSREERQYYLVTVDDEGRLCWAKNGARIDTTEDWKDSIHGIVPSDDETPAFVAGSSNETRLLGDSSTSESGNSDADASDPELEAARDAKYATPSLDEVRGIKKVRHVSAATILDKLLRKSVRKNTWIFVADTSSRLYVGIKNSGAFQHSSFLHGSRISAAGSIKIKNGRLKSLSPLSGHYRPPTSNFRAFVTSLKEQGVDMKHVSISKSYAVLVGLEAYVKTRRKSKALLSKLIHKKDEIVSAESTARREEEDTDKSESAAREREVLEQEAQEREENKAAV